MIFDVLAVFKRSITIELTNSERYYAPSSYSVTVNGKEVLRASTNVVTVDGLLPDTTYEIGVKSELDDDLYTASVKTAHESFLLDVTKFGAVGDGVTNNTSYIQATIAAAPSDATIYIPAGEYLTGPIFLKSDMTLWIDEGAVIKGLTDRSLYPVLPGVIRDLYDNSKEDIIASWEGNPLDCYASLITAVKCENVDIVGKGTIDGNADISDWWVDVRKKRGAWRPKLVFISGCRNVRMQGLSLRNSPSWTVHPYYSDNVSFIGLNIWNPSDSPNTDGFDPESCSDVLMAGCRISVGDDCVAIKSGKLYMANAHYKPIENVEIRNCLLERGHGSVTIGSEVACGVRNIHVSQCVFDSTDRGVRIKTRRGRGSKSVLEEILFEKITMKNVHMPVTVNMFYFCDPDGHSSYVQTQEQMPVDYRTPKIGRFTIQDVECIGVDASFICAYGLPEAPIERITVKRVDVSFLPEDLRKPQCPIMMDNFETLSGRSLYLKNVEQLDIEDAVIRGGADNEPTLINVRLFNDEGLKYE
ncbi:MAG: glycoside hydrolase family 28 protein [Clostridiales bacterium]|nr:glycoside hydrolase family 28 protein [Clostridiales bacterium]